MRFSSVALFVPLVSLLAGPCDVPEAAALEPAAGAGQAVGGFVAVSVDGGVGCGLRDDGSVRCWGWGPAAVSPQGRFSAVSMGDGVACGIRIGGEIHCWGAEGDGSSSPPGGRFAAIGVGHGWAWGHGWACGVRLDGGLACWGERAEEWLVPDGEFRTVDVGVEVACGVRADGAAVCWEDSYSGNSAAVRAGPFWTVEVGNSARSNWGAPYTCGVLESGEIECWDPPFGRLWIRGQDGGWGPPPGRFLDVAVNRFFACGVRLDGEVACWGLRESQNCDFGSSCGGWGEDPHGAVPAGPFTSISVGPGKWDYQQTVCGLRRDGRVQCWNDGTPYVRPPAGAFAAINVDGAMCGLRPGGAVECWGVDGGWRADIPPGAFTAVSASNHGCGLRVGGEVECWGDNTWGAASPPPGEFAAVDVSSRLSCGLRPGGEVVCWGDSRSGATEPPAGRFVAVEARYEYACGLRPDGTAECWGRGWDPESGDPGSVFAAPDFGAPAWRGTYPGGIFSAVSASSRSACGIRPGGAVECWSPYWPPGAGVPDPGAPALVVDRSQGGVEPVGVPEELAWVQGDLPGGPYVALDSGGYHTCGVHPDRTVTCHGADARSPDGEFTTIHVVNSRVCEIRPGGEVACWGVASGNAVPALDFSLAPTENVITLASPRDRFCALVDSGEFVCLNYHYDPPRVERRPGPYSQVTVGGGLLVYYGASGVSKTSSHACAIDPRGRLECWGDNDSGQTALPPRWLDDPPYRAVAAGFAHSCAIGASGAVVCWGDDRHDQTQSPPGEFTALGAGQWHTCGLRSDGEIVCWGDGPAALDQEYDDPPPERPSEPPPGPYTSLAVGQWHSCGLRPDGTATCWLNY